MAEGRGLGDARRGEAGRVPGSGPDDPDGAERASEGLFVRDEMHLAPYRGRGRGKVLTAFEARQAFGSSTLAGLADRPSSGFVKADDEIGGVLRRAREVLRATEADLAAVSGVDEDFVRTAEGGELTMPVRGLLAMARALGIEDWRLGTFPPRAVDGLSAVLRNLSDVLNARGAGGSPATVATPRTAFDLARAAWVLAARERLSRWLGRPPMDRSAPMRMGLHFGGLGGHPWDEGTAMAAVVRRVARLGDRPVTSMTDLTETLFGVPVVHMRLEPDVAGAVVRRGGVDGIVVNLEDRTANAGVMRLTLAHELCHLLDGTALGPVAVGAPLAEDAGHAPSEKRAQAFASELLLPKAAAARAVRSAGDGAVARLVEEYGVSRTAAARQAKLGGASVAGSILEGQPMTPGPRWALAEAPGLTAFGLDLAPPYDGPLAALAEEACREGLISLDTCAELVGLQLADYGAVLDLLRPEASEPRLG